jgi:hypothetical protein
VVIKDLKEVSMDTLTTEQKATNFETEQHINVVRRLAIDLAFQLIQRGMEHDKTKLESPEVDLFVKYTPELAKLQYGSPEYMECPKNLKPALDHHYANSRHHKEHFKNGVNDMHLLDLIEMFLDWKAASMRQQDGNLRKSIEINAERYSIGPQLTRILENSIELVDK